MQTAYRGIYDFGRFLFAGTNLRRIPFVQRVFSFVASHAKDEVVQMDGFKMYVDPVEGIYPDSSGHEVKTTEVFRKYVKKGDVVIDIGADVGYFSLLSASLGAKVLAFEPNPINLGLLLKSKVLNGFNILSMGIALSDHEGDAKFYSAGPHGTLDYDRFNSEKGFDVHVRTLDSLLQGQKADFIKCDTEGSDVKVLRGMVDTLKRNKKVKLVIEFYPELIWKAGDDPKEMLVILENLGFTLYDIDGEGIEVPVTIGELLEKYDKGITNLFCIRK